MLPTAEREGTAGGLSNPQNVWETGVGSKNDETCVLRVKEVDMFYRGAATVAADPVMIENKASKKRRKHSEQKSTSWKKKIHRTRSAAGEEEETITMYLRKADTVIDVR